MKELTLRQDNWNRQLETVIKEMGYTHTNLTHCFLATGVERIEKQQLDNGEDIQVRIFNRDEVMDMLRNGEMLRKFLKGAEEEIYFSNY